MRKLFNLLALCLVCFPLASIALTGHTSPGSVTAPAGEYADTMVVCEDTALAPNYWVDPAVAYYESQGKPFPLKDAVDDYEAGNFKKILADAEEVLKEVPDSWEAIIYKVYAYYSMGKTEKAVNTLVALWEKEIYFSTLQDLMLYFCEEDPQSMHKAMDKVIARHKGESDEDILIRYSACDFAAEACANMGRRKYAVDHYFPQMLALAREMEERGLDLNTVYNTEMLLSTQYLMLDQLDKAEAVLDQMLREGVAVEADLYNNRSIIRRNSGDPQGTLRVLQEAYEINEYDPAVNESLIIELTRQGKYDRAIELATKYIDYYYFKKLSAAANDTVVAVDVIEPVGNDTVVAEGDTVVVDEIPVNDEEIRVEDVEDDISPNVLMSMYLRRGMANLLAGNREEAALDLEGACLLGNDFPGYYHALVLSGHMPEIEPMFNDDYGFTTIGKASLYAAAMLCPDTDAKTAKRYEKEALKYLSRAYELQQSSPIFTAYDVCLRRLINHPDYPAVKKHFNPNN